MTLKIVEGQGSDQKLLFSIGGIKHMDFSSPLTEDSQDLIDLVRETIKSNPFKPLEEEDLNPLKVL